MRLIDADAYLKKIRPRGIADELWTASEAYLSIMRMPTVDAVQVRHGHWIDRSVIGGIPRCECSECETESLIWSRYCHNCGALMDGKWNGNE